MKSYTVNYANANLQRVINNVLADGVMQEARYRWFITSDGVRHEVPLGHGMIFTFGKERGEIMKDNFEAERKAELKSVPMEDLT